MTDTVSATLIVTVAGPSAPVTVIVLGVLGGDLARQPGVDAAVLEVVQQVLGLVLEAQDRDLGAELAVGQRHAVDALADPDRVAVRAGQRVADARAHVGLEARRHRVLEVLGLLVHLVPRHADDVGQEALDHPVAADDALGVGAAGLGEADRAVGVAADVAVALEPADHLRDGRRRELHRAGEVGGGHRQAGLEQPEQRLEVLLLGVGGLSACPVTWPADR